MRILRNHGYKGLNGGFEIDADGNAVLSYCYPKKLVEHINERDFWVDNVENIVYSKIDMVLNCYPLDKIESCLEKVYSDLHKAGYVELLIHEQYFYSDYIDYIPEYEEIVLTAAKWLRKVDIRERLCQK